MLRIGRFRACGPNPLGQDRRSRRPERGWPAYAAVLGVLVLFCPGCDSSPTRGGTPAQDFTSGFAGTVTASGDPYPLWIEADNRPQRDAPVHFLVTTRTDSTGSYRLALPPGLYDLRCRSDDGDWRVIRSDGSFGAAEPLAAPDSGSRRLDLRFPNELRVIVHVPPEWEGRTLRLRTEPFDRDRLGDEVPVREAAAGFRIVELGPGAYRLRVTAAGGTDLWLPPRWPIQPDTVDVPATGRVAYDATIPVPGRLVVRATGSARVWGASVGGWLFDADSSFVSEARSEETDAFEIPVYAAIPRARLLLLISPNSRWYGGLDFHTSLPIDLEPGKEVEIEYFECGIQGTFQPGGVSYPYTRIEARDELGIERGHDLTTGATGGFYIGGLDPGVYYLRVPEGQSWPAHWYDAATTIVRATPIGLDASRILASVAIDSVPPRPGGARR